MSKVKTEDCGGQRVKRQHMGGGGTREQRVMSESLGVRASQAWLLPHCACAGTIMLSETVVGSSSALSRLCDLGNSSDFLKPVK